MTSAELSPAQQQRLEHAIASVPYAALLGIKLVRATAGEASLSLPIRHELTQNQGVVHGGAIASLLDTATAFSILTLLAPEERVTTVDLTISYLRPVTKGLVTAHARVLRQGRRLFSVTADATDLDGTLIATALSTYIKV